MWAALDAPNTIDAMVGSDHTRSIASRAAR
jgi:hypothetical protein